MISVHGRGPLVSLSGEWMFGLWFRMIHPVTSDPEHGKAENEPKKIGVRDDKQMVDIRTISDGCPFLLYRSQHRG